MEINWSVVIFSPSFARVWRIDLIARVGSSRGCKGLVTTCLRRRSDWQNLPLPAFNPSMFAWILLRRSQLLTLSVRPPLHCASR